MLEGDQVVHTQASALDKIQHLPTGSSSRTTPLNDNRCQASLISLHTMMLELSAWEVALQLHIQVSPWLSLDLPHMQVSPWLLLDQDRLLMASREAWSPSQRLPSQPARRNCSPPRVLMLSNPTKLET